MGDITTALPCLRPILPILLQSALLQIPSSLRVQTPIMTKDTPFFTVRGLDMNYTTNFLNHDRGWDAAPRLEDLGADQRIVKSFRHGVLQLTQPLLMVGRRVLNQQSLGVTILAEMLDGGKVSEAPGRHSTRPLKLEQIFWLELPPPPAVTRLRNPMTATPQLRHAINTLREVQNFLLKAYYQMPNAFYIGSDEKHPGLTSWLDQTDPYGSVEYPSTLQASLMFS